MAKRPERTRKSRVSRFDIEATPEKPTYHATRRKKPDPLEPKTQAQGCYIHALLCKLVGPDWSEGYEPSVTDEDIESDATNIATAETIEAIDLEDPQDAISTLASALMLACRELGWLETSQAGHDQWFTPQACQIM